MGRGPDHGCVFNIQRANVQHFRWVGWRPFTLTLRRDKLLHMEHVIKIHVERLPEGVYLATTDDIQGLVAQGRTVAETLEIARDIARKLLEDRNSAGSIDPLPVVTDRSDFTVVVEG
jgi:predicted RNase H-like HicB family nuclease